MVLGKSDKKEICCLVAIKNTAGLHAESSFHIPKSVQFDIRIVRPCTSRIHQQWLNLPGQCFQCVPWMMQGSVVSEEGLRSGRLVPRVRWLRRGQLPTTNKVFVRYLAVLLRTCTTIVAVRFWGSLHDFTMLRQEAAFC